MKPGRQPPPKIPFTPLSQYLGDCVKKWHSERGMTWQELLQALEIVRFNVTEAWIHEHPQSLMKPKDPA